MIANSELTAESFKIMSSDVLKTLGIIVSIMVVGALVRWFLRRLIDQVVLGIAKGTKGIAKTTAALSPLDVQEQEELARRGQRGETIASVLKSATTALVGTAVTLTILAVLKIPVGPLLASAGIVGVALGFGAQSLVKDMISGLFMLAEDQYSVGDSVDLGSASGVVEAVGLRITRLRDADGTVWFVRNGEIERVGNKSHLIDQEMDHPPTSSSTIDKDSTGTTDSAHSTDDA